MATDENAVAAILQLIGDLEKEAADAKRTLNRMLIRNGQPARFSDAELSQDGMGGSQIETDRFYEKSLAPSIRDYLQLRKLANNGPGSLNEIYESLVRGGFKFETENEDNRKRNLRQSLSKNTVMFHRLPNGNYGLVEWYPNLKNGDDTSPTPKKRKSRKHPKAASGTKKTEPKKQEDEASRSDQVPPTVAKAVNNPDTLLDAVRAAIAAMEGEFTKQAVVDWITKHFPERKAADKKTSIFSMIARLKDEMNLKTAFSGKGKEPFRYKREGKQK
jgi:hypothetical protein